MCAERRAAARVGLVGLVLAMLVLLGAACGGAATRHAKTSGSGMLPLAARTSCGRVTIQGVRPSLAVSVRPRVGAHEPCRGAVFVARYIWTHDWFPTGWSCDGAALAYRCSQDKDRTVVYVVLPVRFKKRVSCGRLSIEGAGALKLSVRAARGSNVSCRQAAAVARYAWTQKDGNGYASVASPEGWGCGGNANGWLCVRRSDRTEVAVINAP